MTYEIIDNFLEKEDFEHIIKTFFPDDLKNPNNFAWTYQKGIVRDPELGPTVKPILNKLKIKQLFDIRANILVPTQEHIYHEFHTDRKVSHQVALFYVTTSNGFTILKDTAKVDCVNNRMLLFDGSIEHHSVTSTDSPRCVININYA